MDNRVNIPRFLRESRQAAHVNNMYNAMRWVGEVLCVFSYFNPYGKNHRWFSGEYTSEAFMETLVSNIVVSITYVSFRKQTLP
jgi:hypothetical protein